MNLIALTIAQIQEVIRLAEIRAAKSTEKETSNSVVLAKTHIPEVEWQQLLTALKKLSAATQIELMAFTWLGQGTIGDDLDRWEELVQFAQLEIDNDIPSQLASMVNLHKFLSSGLLMIGQGHVPRY